jgi:hypothetical protein
LAGIGAVGVDGFMAATPGNGERSAKVRVHHPFVDRGCEPWEWCLHCEKAGPVLDWKGGALDMWPWSKVRALNPSYPKCPMLNVVYPLYGDPATDTVTDSEAPRAPGAPEGAARRRPVVSASKSKWPNSSASG